MLAWTTIANAGVAAVIAVVLLLAAIGAAMAIYAIGAIVRAFFRDPYEEPDDLDSLEHSHW